MRLLLAIVLALAAAAPASAAPVAKVRVAACDAQAKSATFESDMHTVAGAARMQVRFALLTRDGRRWARVKAPGFGQWQTSNPGVARYVYAKTVQALPPGRFRVRVRFRWLDGAGRVVARRARMSAICRQPDPRPDLRASVFAAQPRGFAVRVRNAGAADAAAFRVTVTVGSGPARIHVLDGMEAAGSETWIFDEPCRGTVRVAVDSEHQVDERREDDNVLEAPCPT